MVATATEIFLRTKSRESFEAGISAFLKNSFYASIEGRCICSARGSCFCSG